MATDTTVRAPGGSATGTYVDVDGLRTYYEVRGSGDPVLLLHGGFATIETWEVQAAALAERYTVYLPERRGHGRTPDAPGPYSYALMARDTIGLMEKLGIGPAHAIGWSDGGEVALEMALMRPEQVRTMVLIGAPVDVSGSAPELLAFLPKFRPEHIPEPMRRQYATLSPDGPEHFEVVFEKLLKMWQNEPRHDLSELADVATPTLFMVGDDDDVTIEHVAAARRAMPNAQLAVVPGTDHGLMFEKPELVNRLLLDFLADEQPRKIFRDAPAPA
ncbi:MAG TPA: alpha/beta hydrolase [Vicinamibacterales bacterium]|nr:alpha/beta hydrolase [Vicinamibacterales bacterium]